MTKAVGIRRQLGGVPMAVAPWIVSDGLWSRIEPLLPRVERRFRYPGRKRLPDRQALQGILFVLYTGIAWRHLPLELGFGGGSTCYRRMVEWQRAGVWERLHELLLAELRAAGAGWSSAPSPGCTTSSACSFATTAATKSTKPSSRSAAASSASGGFRTHCDSSSKPRSSRAASPAPPRPSRPPSGCAPPA